MYAKNPHYCWQLCTAAQTSNLPPGKVQYARDFVGKEVVLTIGGCRKKTVENNEEVNGEINGKEEIPIEYQQEHEAFQNSRVWLAACLVVRSVDVNLATGLLAKYRHELTKFLNGCVFSTRNLRIVTHYTNIFNGRLNATLLFAG